MSVKILQALYILFFVPFTYTIYICPSEEGSAQPQVARDVSRDGHTRSGFAQVSRVVSRRAGIGYRKWFCTGIAGGIAGFVLATARTEVSQVILYGKSTEYSTILGRSYIEISNKKYIQNSLLGPKQEASLHPNR